MTAIAVPTASNVFTIDELLRQPGSALTRAELDAMDQQVAVGDQISIEQEAASTWQ